MLDYPISLELSSEEDDPLLYHLIPENHDFELKVTKLDAELPLGGRIDQSSRLNPNSL